MTKGVSLQHYGKICIWCGVDFMCSRSNRKYCSKKCGSRASFVKMYPLRSKELLDYGFEWRKKNYAQKMLSHARVRARKRNLECTITVADCEVPEVCPVLGFPLVIHRGGALKNSPSLDRIDNDKGYVKGNVIVVSLHANRIKYAATPEEILKVGEFYARLQEKVS